MSTKQYADYISGITGKKKSAASVANDCRNGHLDCYRDGENGDWRIIVKRTYVPVAEYDKLLAEYEKAMGALKSIRKLAECS
jgi:hypothetical protein